MAGKDDWRTALRGLKRYERARKKRIRHHGGFSCATPGYSLKKSIELMGACFYLCFIKLFYVEIIGMAVFGLISGVKSNAFLLLVS